MNLCIECRKINAFVKNFLGRDWNSDIRIGKKQNFFKKLCVLRFGVMISKLFRFAHLMNNHVHLAIQVADIPLSRIIQNLSFRYTKWINWRQGRSGHLFQGPKNLRGQTVPI